MKAPFERWGDQLIAALVMLVRPKSVVVVLLMSSVALLLGAIAAGFVFKVTRWTPTAGFELSFNTSSGPPAYAIMTVMVVGVVMIGVAIALHVWQTWRDHRAASCKRVLIIEADGLRSRLGRPLHEDVPKDIVGHRETRVLNFHQMYEAEITDPALGLDEAHSLPGHIRQAVMATDRADLTVVYGGVAPVPYTFLSGVLVDDREKLTVMDWDRSAERWRILDGTDDGERFTISGTEELSNADEVVIAISVSYRVQATNVHAAFPGRPVIWLTLENGNTSSHWSSDKQAALATQFHDVLGLLEGKGTRRIDVILAAPNSLVFRFGRTYDRNLPPLVVWQYEREQPIPYPWGILMPPGGRGKASVVRSSEAKAAA